ncbi:AAA family ATPase [Natrinema zhouii]|uniref:Chromosome segregation protein SMC n=1 Tax=Natrinema zhouii TaxID=1710539 RepID=A0A7D6CS04_9EURY|nr:archaea-specific SMC-related protein [Natrinema zhouii]QLK27269.1 AAA family ATPase [Natrinema zhouii]
MDSAQKKHGTAHVDIQNIGGIDRTDVSFEPGVTVLVGRNATNRTSFQTALMAALGSDRVSLKGDAEEGHVELSIDGETYSRALNRDGTAVQTTGDAYLDDPMLGDLFAFLLEDNEARQAVARGGDLREIIMRPIDTAEIQAEIDRLRERRSDVERRLDEIDSLKRELPSLEAEKRELDDEIEEKKSELSEIEGEIDHRDADIEESRQTANEADEKLDELQETRRELNDVRYDLETERDSVAELRSELQELEDERAELSEINAGELQRIESDVERLRSKKRAVESEISELQSILQFNEGMLEDVDDEILSALDFEESEQESVTDRLVPDDTVQCWTCGSTVEADQIEATVDTLRELSRTKFQTVREIDDDLEELKKKKRAIQQQRQRRERLDTKLEQVEQHIERSTARIEDLQDRRDDLTQEIERIEETIDKREDEERSEILSLHRDANQLEYELGQLENERERVDDEITAIEERLAEQRDLEDEADEIRDEIERLRTRIDRIEQEAVEAFNQHMNEILDRLGYENLERIWLERVDSEVRDGRKTVSKTMFELHIVRTTASGTSYEDTVDHLSESERNVAGLVFALAGYLAHDVYETLPFMVLDSLEAIDSKRIAKLVDYFQGYCQYLVVALLPEDAESLDADYERITEI